MQAEHMVHNANGIAQYFASYPHDEAVAGVLDHIKKYWEKRMRAQIIDYVALGGAGLHELVLEAVKQMQAPEAAAARK
jgi:formate dehydrogenase subunit delta